MTVIPKRAALPHVELIGKCVTRSYALKTDAGYAIHCRRQNHSVPVNGRVVRKIIANPENYALPLTPSQNRSGYRAVNDCRGPLPAGEVDRPVPDVEIKLLTTEFRNPCTACSARWRAHHTEADDCAACRDAGNELPA